MCVLFHPMCSILFPSLTDCGLGCLEVFRSMVVWIRFWRVSIYSTVSSSSRRSHDRKQQQCLGPVAFFLARGGCSISLDRSNSSHNMPIMTPPRWPRRRHVWCNSSQGGPPASSHASCNMLQHGNQRLYRRPKYRYSTYHAYYF